MEFHSFCLEVFPIAVRFSIVTIGKWLTLVFEKLNPQYSRFRKYVLVSMCTYYVTTQVGIWCEVYVNYVIGWLSDRDKRFMTTRRDSKINTSVN